MASSKTPYELRTELLQMAMDILHQQAHARHNKENYERYQKDVAEYGADNAKMFDFGSPYAPTTEEVIEEAQKLNQFIQTNTSKS